MAESAPVDPVTPNDELRGRIKKQMDFYFSDLNYPRDAFLKSLAAKDTEGWIDLSVIATFERMKNLTTDLQLIADSLKGSDVLAVSDDGKRVRRVKPLPQADTSKERTVYVKGLPMDSTLDSLTNFFTGFGVVECVRMRRLKDKTFKGSVFVTFSTIEQAKLLLGSKPTLGSDEPLHLEEMNDYAARKRNERQAGKRKRKPDDGEAAEDATPAQETNGEKKEAAETKPAARQAKRNRGEYDKGLIVKFSGVAPEMTVPQLKEWFNKPGKALFIDFFRGQQEGFIRYGDEATANKAVEELSAEKKEHDGKPIQFVKLEGALWR